MKNLPRQFLNLAFGSVLFFALCHAAVYAQNPQSVGTLTAVKNEVKVSRDGAEAQTQQQGARAFLGDFLETGDDSGAKILFEDDTLISLGANAEFEITEFVYAPNKRKSLSTLTKGKLKSIVQRVEGESDVQYATPNAVCGIKGTTLLIDAKGIFCAVEGSISVKGKTKEVTVNSGQCSRIIDGEPSDPESLTEQQLGEFADTDFEIALFRDLLNRNLPIGSLFDTPGTTNIPEALSSLPQLPLEQPADQLPGVDSNGRLPIDIIINP
ncbi:MAG: FecR family protein [Deltaproteobacteria bacterium]